MSIKNCIALIIAFATAVMLASCGSTPPPPGTPVPYPGGGAINYAATQPGTFNSGGNWCEFLCENNNPVIWPWVGKPPLPFLVCWGDCRVVGDCALADGVYALQFPGAFGTINVKLTAIDCLITCLGHAIVVAPVAPGAPANPAVEPVPSPVP